MAADDRLGALIAEYQTLQAPHDRRRMREIMAEGATLVDPERSPKKWAAFRSQYGQLTEPDDPREAMAAYEDALTVWTPEHDRDPWIQCHSSMGCLLAQLGETERALSHLEIAVDDHLFLASTLAVLYRFRSHGDPVDNWRKRMRYLEIASASADVHQKPKWANEIAIAYGEEPGADFARAMEARIQHHEQALAAASGDSAIEIRIDLSEAYQFRVLGDPSENQVSAEQHAREALDACGSSPSIDLKRRALLSLARARSIRGRYEEALALVDQAQAITTKPELLANIAGLRSNVQLEMSKRGIPIASGATGATQAMEAALDAGDRRRALQISGEVLLETNDFGAAARKFEAALQCGEALLAEASSTAGRMERIFELADTAAVLSYAYLKQGEIGRAIDALETGKVRLWRSAAPASVQDELATVVPPGGALLFANFAAREGAVVIVTRNAPPYTVWLPRFDKQRLYELQRGAQWHAELGGWLLAYSFRRSQPERWRHELEQISRTLYEEVWALVLEQLPALGVRRDAELVWLNQSGSGVFPWHAAAAGGRCVLDEYAVRYAPAARLLFGASPRRARAVLVSVPAGDLPWSTLECAWAAENLDRAVMRLDGAAATKEAVAAALRDCGLWHVSTHAAFSLDDPLASSIALADGHLTLGELMPLLRQEAPDVIALSACETAVARVTTTPDEFVGFPAALLSCGTRTVLATLWPVEDETSALLVARFYRECSGATPAQALRAAQNWLRAVTARELLEWLRPLRDELPLAAQLRTSLRGEEPGATPYSDPAQWAAFTISGQ